MSGTLCRPCHLGRLFCRLRQWDFVPSGAFSWIASPVYRREWWMVRQGGEEQPALQKGTSGVDVSFVCDMSRAPHAWGTPLVGEEQKVVAFMLVSGRLGTERVSHVPANALSGRPCSCLREKRHPLRPCSSLG